MIEVPPKIWRPKVQSKYTMPEYGEDIDDGVFDFSNYGNAVFRPTMDWQDHVRDDIITFESTDQSELDLDLRMGDEADDITKTEVIRIIMKYWDSFCKRGAKRTILGYEFAIDTGNAKPVCCRKPSYGPYEGEIIMAQIRQLLGNEWIDKCGGPWGSQIVLAAKPHQEHVESIEDFIWRMCVSYRKLNSITKPFQYPIPRCDDSVTFMGVGSDIIFFISLDARQGYHQVSVRCVDREKLAFFAPDDNKYCFNVMPFGPTNAPGFYTAMMKNLKDEWDLLFIIILRAMKHLDGEIIRVTDANEIFLGKKKIVSGSRTIIDDILLYCSNIKLILIYFECVCKVFQKYRVSFRLDKCEFLKSRVEYVGVDLMRHGNTPAQSKFDMINHWTLPTSGQSLFSFIGLVNFYHRYAPYFEIRLKPLRRLCKRFYRKEIPMLAWTPALISLFEELKVGVTSSPILARFDPDKPTFLKTDWSAEGMGWILMQPADDAESQKASALLKKTGECLFDLSMTGARLKPVFFGSRSCNDIERKYHSFTGEGACGRWAIGQNRKFLWGCHFYWMCDCSAVKELLEYDGNISMISRWAQELLGYHFTVIHRPARMMRDVDGLTRRFGPLIARHIMIACILAERDRQNRPSAYDHAAFSTNAKASMSEPLDPDVPWPVLVKEFLSTTHAQYLSTSDSSTEEPNELHLATSPVMLVHAPSIGIHGPPDDAGDRRMRTLDIPESLDVNWLCVNDITGSSLHWVTTKSPMSPRWSIHNIFVDTNKSRIFDAIHGSAHRRIVSLDCIENDLRSHPNMHLIDIHYVKERDLTIADWINSICSFIHSALTSNLFLQAVSIWIPGDHFPPSVHALCRTILSDILVNDWVLTQTYYDASHAGDAIAARRYVLRISHETSSTNIPSDDSTQPPPDDLGYGQYLATDSPDNAPTKLILRRGLPMDSYDEHSPQLARSLAILSSGNNSNGATISSADLVLDPAFPAAEPVSEALRNPIMGRRFGIPIAGFNDHDWRIRSMTNSELMQAYSIPASMIPQSTSHATFDTLLNDLLPFSNPWKLRDTAINAVIVDTGILDQFAYSNSIHCDTMQCYFTKRTPETLDWTVAYENDPSTQCIMAGLIAHKANEWSKAELKLAGPGFILPLEQGRISIVNGKLVLFKPVFQHIRYVGLIIVPRELQQKLFSHYHAGPSGGHMGEYKTLFRMRLRFFWPGLRKNVREWVKGCGHCTAYNVWRSRKSELYFSWPVTTPFYIMHMDLWAPGKITNKTNGKTQMLLNTMCDLTQFVVSSVVENPTAEILAQALMEDVVLTFGMVAVVVVDADSKFLHVFEEMCTALKIMFWPLARGNHKGNSVERYHRFLDKTQTIVGQDRGGQHDTFIQNAKTSQYAWNSAPIDDTDISRSMAAVGREFKFPMDVELSAMPLINSNKKSALYKYLRDVSNNSTFAVSVIQVLIEERRAAHRDRWNKDKDVQPFEVGDVVKAHVQVTSKADTGAVAKLSYRAKGPFQITKILGYNSYEVKRYNEPTSASRKYKGTELYLLPPTIYPHEPLDMMDERYLNYSHAPIVSPLKNALKIEMYNDTFFSPTDMRMDSSPTRDQPITGIDSAAFQVHLPPSADSLFEESGNVMPPIEDQLDEPGLGTAHIVNADSITASKDRLFFIRFTPDRTMRARWYLIQIDMQATTDTNPTFQTNGKYWCVFLAKHPDDKSKSDEFSRWWPEWYRYSQCPTTNAIIYGDRILIRPNTTPDSRKFIQWATDIQLTGEGHNAIVGPFNFEDISAANRVRQKVSHTMWTHLNVACDNAGMLPPTFGSNYTQQIRTSSKPANPRKRKSSK